MPDGLCIVTKCMKLICQHVKASLLWGMTFIPIQGVLLLLALSGLQALSMRTGCWFPCQIKCMELATHFCLKFAKNFPKPSRTIVKVIKCCLCMQTQLPECMPGGKFKKKVEEHSVEWLWRETFKCWYWALVIWTENQCQKQVEMKQCRPEVGLQSHMLWALSVPTHCHWIFR